ncbi:hypothetical protein C4544_02165 [candidate division WS5 bacterium]|uniref:Lipoprotein n=1 Tax=candidate division WS5 bacterium TaxID=2093353 RepID=A0A419DER4_9BACT|nr:MAG: hypothetical protein C4544_02165 [candidate division WS5 bacterium]
MKIIKLISLTLMVLLLLVSCSKPKVNVLVVPKNKDAYCTAKQVSSSVHGTNLFEGTKTIELYDNNNIMSTCKIEYQMTENSLSCDGKVFAGHLTCFNNRHAELKITSTSCTEAYGVAVGDTGDEYDVYVGLSDSAMKDKMNELNKIILGHEAK